MIAFGPIPSRRLGRSLGVNNIPPKICTYSCVYCQVGRTMKLRIKRQNFYSPDRVFRDVKEKVDKAKFAGVPIDYLTFVPDGEPTLDRQLGKTIDILKPLGIKIAVITNSSLVWCADVQHDLHYADWISLKIDAVRTDIWRKINRPRRQLDLEKILNGIHAFSESFEGTLAVETMLVKGYNDSREHLEEISDYLKILKPDIAYLSVPTRPPAEIRIEPPGEKMIIQSYDILARKLPKVEYLIGYEGNEFAFTGDIEEDLLSITSVHPMREDAVQDYLASAHADWHTIDKLIEENKLSEVTYQDKKFYMRKFFISGKNKQDLFQLM